MSVNWVSILGPGGLLALLVVVDRIITKWRRARAEAQLTVIANWREMARERDTVIRSMRSELDDAYNQLDYWRARSGHVEYLCRVHNIPLSLPAALRPAPEPEDPEQPGDRREQHDRDDRRFARHTDPVA